MSSAVRGEMTEWKLLCGMLYADGRVFGGHVGARGSSPGVLSPVLSAFVPWYR